MITLQARNHPLLKCKQHRLHQLDCQAFVQLLDRSGGACEVCGMEWDLTVRAGRPQIEHDHASPIWAVRGLLCYSCNGRLGRIEAGQLDPEAAFTRYLDNAWYRTDGAEIYRARAMAWMAPSARVDRDMAAAAMFSGPVPEGYLRIQEAREAWCQRYLEDQRLYMSAAMAWPAK